MEFDEALIAHHEAGHAVVAILAGGRVESATIERDYINSPQQAGRVSVAWRPEQLRQAKQQAKRHVQVLLAGPVAEMIYRGERLHPAAVPEWKYDWDEAFQHATKLQPDESTRWRILEQTCVELYRSMSEDRCWQAISEVADLLLAHESIDGDHVAEAVERWL